MLLWGIICPSRQLKNFIKNLMLVSLEQVCYTLCWNRDFGAFELFQTSFINKMLKLISFYINSIPLQGRYIVLQYELYDLNVFIICLEAWPCLLKTVRIVKIKTVWHIKSGLWFKAGRGGTGWACSIIPHYLPVYAMLHIWNRSEL